jgi:hypothetical protein
MRRRVAVFAVLTGLMMTVGLTTALVQERAGDVTVTVTYTGKGKVDDTHEIWVFLFDTPNVGRESQPLATQAVKKSGGTATFKNISQDPVYVLFAFDETGNYDGTAGPPPPGTPIGMYSTDGKAPAPVKPGTGAKVKATFDDTRRMGQQ